jgi:opacity protein-like surface antigen
MLQRKMLAGLLFSIGVIGLNNTANADTAPFPGFYLGVQGGYAKADYGDVLDKAFNAIPGHNISKGQYGGRAYVGWQFNPNLAVETGYNYLQNNDYQVAGGLVDVTEKMQAWDLLGKASLPFSAFVGQETPFSLYAKAGGAYVRSEVDASVAGLGSIASTTSNQVKPEAGIGVECNFTEDLSADLSYSHIFGQKTSLTDTEINAPIADMAYVGLRYLFS